MIQQTTPDETAYSCFSCGADWSHIGSDTPDAECPDCGSRAVSPIGRLDYEGAQEVELDDDVDTEFIRAVATDATGREFRFLFALDSSPRRATLQRVVVKCGDDYNALDLRSEPLSPESVRLPDIRPQVRLAAGRRPVRVTGQQETR